MKKIITITITILIAFSCIMIIPTEESCAATKYIKVKKSTYQKYQKAYKNQTSLKKTINELNTTIKEKKSTISWLWSTLEDFGYNYNYDTHKWESTKASIKISKDTLEIEQRGFICIAFNGKTINTASGYYVYADSLTFDPETQTYSGEEIHGSPYKEFYGEDYELVVDYNYGHQMYLEYIS